jgi:hypothetical protein
MKLLRLVLQDTHGMLIIQHVFSVTGHVLTALPVYQVFVLLVIHEVIVK